jgi:hypothetical protein
MPIYRLGTPHIALPTANNYSAQANEKSLSPPRKIDATTRQPTMTAQATRPLVVAGRQMQKVKTDKTV